MTIRLLQVFNAYPVGAIYTADAATEARLIAMGAASTDLTGGHLWVPWPAPTGAAAAPAPAAPAPAPTPAPAPAPVAAPTAAPTHVQIVLQGQDKQEDSHSAQPTQPNHLSIAWKSVSGASAYKVYRSVDQGPYTLLTTVTAAQAAGAFGAYLASSGGYDYPSDVDCLFQDTAATNCVGTYGKPIANGTPKAPDANGVYFMPNVGYTYKVSAVGAGGESALSADSIGIFFANGLEILNHPNGWFDGDLVIKDAGAAGLSPLGYSTSAKWTTSAGKTILNPFSGGGAVDGNLSVKGWNYLVMNVQAAQDGSSFTLGPELSGDQGLLKAELDASKYGTLKAGQWVQLKIPLADLLVDQLGGKNARQFSFYKVTLNSRTPGQVYWLEWYFTV